MDSRTGSHLHLNLSDHNDPEDVIDVLFLEAFASGALRRARKVHLPRVKQSASMLPPGIRPLRLATTGRGRSVLAGGDGWLLRARRWPDGSGDISVLARTAVLAERILTDASRRSTEVVPVDPHEVSIGFWHFSAHGPSRSESGIAAQPWETIRRNYTSVTAQAGDRLMALGPESLGGRLLLLHGPPGTGKTTMLRALSIAWRPWCRVDCVLDPERLFNEPMYLLEVSLADNAGAGRRRPGDEAPERWCLLVLEDCDELIRPGAKSVSGQALARLLNITDGLLGHGRRLLVAITTNEPLAALHPAVTRPGRCLAQIEVGRFTRAEAHRWLGRHPDTGGDPTLAELYGMQNDSSSIETTATAPSTGQYL